MHSSRFRASGESLKESRVSRGEVRILTDGAAIAKQAADELIRIAGTAVKDHGRFTIALAGGSTPKALYHLLVDDPALRSRVPWDKMGVFFGDERHVGPGQQFSNGHGCLVVQGTAQSGTGKTDQRRVP
jgi:Glucosamine-6-phosphate isomerases/6-phosphogluconolactonase